MIAFGVGRGAPFAAEAKLPAAQRVLTIPFAFAHLPH